MRTNRFNRLPWTLAAFVLCGGLSARAQNIQTLSVDEVVSMSLANNHDLKATRHGSEISIAADHEVRGALLPSVSASGSYTRLSDIPSFELTLPAEFASLGDFSVPSIRNRYDFSVRVDQPLFSGGRLLNQKRSAGLLADASVESVNAAEAEVAYAARAAYWNVYQAEASLEVSEAAQRSVEAQLAATITRREQGAALRSDVLTVQARLGEVKLDVLEARNAVKVAHLKLNEIVGLPMDDEIHTIESAPLDWSNLDPASLTQTALDDDPSVQAARLTADALDASARAERAGWLPQIGIVAIYQYARPNQYIFPLEDTFKGTWQAGLSATWQLWNWGQTKGRYDQARARAAQANERLVSEERSTQFAVREAVMNVEHARLATSVAEQNVRRAESSFAEVKRRMDLGAAVTAEVLDAELADRTARLREVQARVRYQIALAALWRELGITNTPQEPNR